MEAVEFNQSMSIISESYQQLFEKFIFYKKLAFFTISKRTYKKGGS